MSIKESITQIVIDTKTAVATAAVTTGTGLGTVLNLIPSNIGELATLAGFILSCVLIFTHYRKGSIEYKKIKLEMEILQEKLNRDKKRGE
jgi:hypothetical protein